MQTNKNARKTTTGLIIDDNMRNIKDKKQLFNELRKQNNIKEKPKFVLNVNWEDARAWQDGNQSIIVNDTPEFKAKDNSYAQARIDYAAALIVSKLEGCNDTAASIVEAWSSQYNTSRILWVRSTRESVTHLFKTRFKCKRDPGINFKAYVTKAQFENKKNPDKNVKY